jgi:NADPH2:quinone reductase
MKALAALAYGPAQELKIIDLPVPTAGSGQIQVRIAAATINPTDMRVFTGEYKDLLPVDFPYVLGTDFAGTVIQVGSGVDRYTIGDEVFGQALPRQLRSVTAGVNRPSLSTGTLAEFAVFEADTPLLARRPASVAVEQAAALAISGMTTRALLKIAAMDRGQTALVIGATGGVGTSLLPALAAGGIHTIATVSSAEKGALATRLGASQLIGHDPIGYPGDVDVVFNLALFADRIGEAAKSLKAGGKMVSIMFPPATPADLRRDDVEFHFMLDMEGTYGGMRDVAEAAAAGNLTVEISGIFSFERAVEAAIAYQAATSPGKIVVIFPTE